MKSAFVITILACLAVIAVAGHASQDRRTEPQRKHFATEQRPVGAFSAVELTGPFDVVVHAQAATNAVELSGERRDLDDIETFVRGDTLVVRSKPRRGFYFSFGRNHRDQTRVTISAPVIKSLDTSGSGDVMVDQLAGDKVALAVNGPGDLHASGAVRDLAVSTSGSGDADLRHLSSARLELTMSGPGDVLVADVGNEMSVNASGSGDLAAEHLHVGRLVAQLSGPGSVTLQGEAGELNAEVTGSDDLHAKSLKVANAVIRSHGPGGTELSTVSDTLDAELHSSGGLDASMAGKRLLLEMHGPADASISGTVDMVRARLSGSGSLGARRLVAGRADVHVDGPGSAEVYVLPQGAAAGAHASLLTVERNSTRQVME